MEKKNTLRFTFIIVAIIVGVALHKQVDFKNLTVQNPWLAVIYAIVFLFSIFYLAKNRKRATDHN